MAGAATVEKALDVLFHLHGAGTSLGLSEIGRALDLPKSSCHRLLSTLVDREIVERDERGRYRPGMALLSLGLSAQAHEPMVRASRPALESIARELGETAFLVARRHGRLRVLDKREGSAFLRAAPDIGDEIPEDVTAVGRLYRVLSNREASGLDASIRDTPPEAEETVAAVEADDRVRELGFATNRDAWIEGLAVLAVPIWQDRPAGRRELAGTLALGAASARFEALGQAVIAAHLLEAAVGIRDRLGLRSASKAIHRR